ncbi:hypothetical protein DH2020_034888 [Rehmannia glutinosa]|uniref:Pentatricopeptide repeat-containing protein n=1 Tax=Rehmannia glutinosa TaxID=99300 RepID=A0ABR0V8X2_REHGL
MIKRNIRSQFCQGLRIWSTNHQNYSRLSSDHQHEDLISLLQSCEQASQTAQIHGLMLKTGLDQVPFPLSKLLAQVSMQDIPYAASIFKHIESPNLYMFNTMLRGHSVNYDPRKGLILFNYMRAENHSQHFLLDQFTFVSVLKSCSRLLEVWAGLCVHTVVLKSGFDVFLNVKNALLQFYCVCGRIEDAHQLFDDLGELRDLVSTCVLPQGWVLSNLNVVTALISMYAKNGHIYSARQIFDEIDVQKDVVLWNCLIDGYAKSGLLEEALELLRLMKHYCIKPNSSTLACLLSACSASGSLAIGQYVHSYIEDQHLVLDVILGTSIVDMYAKSGLLEKAIDVFDRMESKDVMSWTAMISAYGVHGQANRAIALFHRMEEKGFSPNEVTFLAVLNSCSHGGLVAEGMGCFRRMVEVYKLMPKIEHHGCLIDLLGRAGLLDEAVYGNVDLAERVKRELEQINEEHPADSLALTSTYAVAGIIPDYSCVLERKMKEMDHDQSVKKEAGCSTIEFVV